MSYHFIEVSAPHSRLWLKDHQLRFEQPDKTTKTLLSEDIAGIIVTSPDCTIHSSLLSGCGQLAVPRIVLCKRYRPASVVVPSNRGADTSFMRACIIAKKGLLDRLWHKTNSAKIKNQAHLLCHLEISPSNCKLLEMFSSGRMPGREARAVGDFSLSTQPDQQEYGKAPLRHRLMPDNVLWIYGQSPKRDRAQRQVISA